MALAPAEAESVSAEMLSEHVRAGRQATPAAGVVPTFEHDLNRAVDTLKRAMIDAALQQTGSKTRAAQRLGIPRQSLQKMMKRLGIRDAGDA